MPGKMSDPGTMPNKIMKSGGDVGEDEEIRASSREGSRQVPEKVGSGSVPEKVESRRVLERWNPGMYRERVESEQVPKK